MFQLLLSSAYPKLRTFQFPMLCQQAGVQEAGREQSWGSWPELAKGIFHTMEHHAQYINRGELARRCRLLLGHWSAGGEQLHRASLDFSWVLFLFFFFCYIPFHYYYHYYYYISVLLLLVLYFTLVIKLFLSQFTRFTFFPNSPSHPTGSRGGVRERLHGA